MNQDVKVDRPTVLIVSLVHVHWQLVACIDKTLWHSNRYRTKRANRC